MFRGLGVRLGTDATAVDWEASWQAFRQLRHYEIGVRMAAIYADPAKRAQMKPEAQWEMEGFHRLTGAALAEASRQRQPAAGDEERRRNGIGDERIEDAVVGLAHAGVERQRHPRPRRAARRDAQGRLDQPVAALMGEGSGRKGGQRHVTTVRHSGAVRGSIANGTRNPALEF